MTTMGLTCKERVKPHLKGRISDLRLLFSAWQQGNEEQIKDAEGNEPGTFNEYGLAFDYVEPGTFTGQRRGYFRYQLSTGGPGDEFRFYCDERLNLTSVQYWFLDWFDGAKIVLKGKDLDLLTEIFEDFRECGTVEALLRESQEGER